MSRRIIVDEVEVEVPYGKMSGKSWHEDTDDCKRVLLLHGWMDNSGSFDNLAPLLKHEDGLYIVSLDLPGHGKSSQLPDGVAYSDMTMMSEIRRCIIDLGWNKETESGNFRPFTIVGHSFGAGLAMFYSSLYPDEIENMILLDFIKPKSYQPKDCLKTLATMFDDFVKLVPSENPKGKRPDKGQVVVSQDTAVIATINAHEVVGKLRSEDATCLLKRSTVPVSTPPNSVIYSRDLRLQCMFNMRDNWDIMKVYFDGLKCNILAILSKDGLYMTDAQFKDHLDEMKQFLKEKAKSIHIQWAPGDHYLHLNNAKVPAEIINKYLKSPEKFETTSI